MTTFETSQVTFAYRDQCQDRADAIHDGDRTIIVVADGAGGMNDGALAADTVMRDVRSDYRSVNAADEWNAELKRIDQRISTGETTAVVVDLKPGGICGASVGDSQAWLIHDGNLINLTIHQNRKPLLGSREAMPTSFSGPPLDGLLVVATDGFCNYANKQDLLALISQSDFISIPRRCVEMVQLPSGDLWDDIGIVACRIRPPHRTRKRYAI